jgi:hypothetical protein
MPPVNTQAQKLQGACLSAHHVVSLLVGSDTLLLKGFKTPDKHMHLPTVSSLDPALVRRVIKRHRRIRQVAVWGGVTMMLMAAAMIGFIVGASYQNSPLFFAKFKNSPTDASLISPAAPPAAPPIASLEKTE